MRKLLCLSVIIVILIVIACQPPISFTEPQPKNVAALSGFPKRIQGKYLSADDSTFLQITANSMIRIYDFNEKLYIDDLDSTQQIIGDSLYDLTTNTSQLISIEGDSISMHSHEVDTLFSISQLNVLKKFKGFYFININVSPDSWQVKKLDIAHGKLILNDINTKEDLAQLRAITENNQDTMPYIFTPTRHQFREFVRNEGFRDNEVFWKLKE